MKKSVLDYALKVRVPVTVFIILASFALTYYVSRSERDGVGYAPEQPIDYSHKLHAGELGIDCQYCHTSADETRHASVPSASICMNCHAVAKTDSEEIKKLKKYHDENKPIPWKRIHKLADFAYFSHSAHVNSGIDCQSCHGEIQEMEVVEQVQSWNMSDCLDCHRDPESHLPYLKGQVVEEAPTNCNACHR